MVETDSKAILLGNESNIDFTELKDVCRELNDAIDVYNSETEEQLVKIRVVGVKKGKVLEAWHDAVDFLADAEFEGVPASSIEFWNKNCPDPDAEDVGAASSEVDEPDEDTEPDSDEPDEGAEPEPAPKATPKKATPKKKDPAKAKDKKDDKPGSSSGKRLVDFKDLQERLQNPQTPTGQLDLMCLEGGTVDELLAKFKKYVADSGIEFKALQTPHSIKKHIEYRIERGWIYQEDDEIIKLVGYEKKK